MLRLSLNLILLAALAHPGSQVAAQRARFLMGTTCEGTAWADSADRAAEALDAAFDEIARLEAILSDYRPDSELSRLNRNAYGRPVVCSPDLFDFIERSVAWSRLTQGAFDLTVGPLVAAWDLRGPGRTPSPREIALARDRVGSHLLWPDTERRAVRFGVEGMVLDPGAIGKGYALDAAARVLREHGIRSALIDFGGQVLALGSPPGAAAWEVDVAHPLRRDEALFTVRLRDASIATSGRSERGDHVIDPRSGRPVGGAASVSVIAEGATAADAVSTALLVMGPDTGVAWAERRADLSAAFLVVEPGRDVTIRATKTFEKYPAGDAAAGSHRKERRR